MAQARKVESEREARRYLSAASAAGVVAGEWARARGIDGRSLNAWRMNLERRGTKRASSKRRRVPRVAATSGLVELVPARSSAAAISAVGSGRYVLDVRGARVEFGDDFSEETLRRVLEVVRSC